MLIEQKTSSGAEFIRSHAEFGEVFSEWKLFEAARSCFNALSKKWNLMSSPSLTELNGTDTGIFTKVMSEKVDFLHPKINNSVILQNMQALITGVSTTLWDGVAESDMQMIILELCKLCATGCIDINVCLRIVVAIWLLAVIGGDWQVDQLIKTFISFFLFFPVQLSDIVFSLESRF